MEFPNRGLMPPLYVCWTIDWQDNDLWENRQFLAVSSRLHEMSCRLLGGRVTWLAEVDDLTDITLYESAGDLTRRIEASGGEVGIHIHHTSVDPAARKAHYRHAVEQVRRVGGHPAAYAAGMGNYINDDTRILVELGIRAQRSYTGNYINGALPPDDWLPPDKRGRVSQLFPRATLDKIPDPTQNPAACDWRGAPDRAGYTDPDDYRKVLDEGDLFAVPLGISDGNEDGLHQLHVQPRISLERLRAIFDGYQTRSELDPVFVACYFHPYDLLAGDTLSEQLLERWVQLVTYQQMHRSRFMTLNEAREAYERSVRNGRNLS